MLRVLPTSPFLLALATACGDPAASHGSPRCDVPTGGLEPYTVTVRGTGFDDHEGTAVFVLNRMVLLEDDGGRPACENVVETTVVGGGFEVVVDNLTDGAVYPLVAAYLDLDGDGACGSSTEPSWADIWLIDIAIDLTPDWMAVDPEAGCEGFVDGP